MKIIHYICALLCGLLALTACENKLEDFKPETITDYAPYEIGKYITYRLDSLVFANSGNDITTRSYQVKHTVTGTTTDNNGNKVFIITRSLNNEGATGNWVANGTYTVTPSSNKLETTDNNLRIITLVTPLKQGYSWMGNSHLTTAPYYSLFDMNAGSDMNKWNFIYTASGDTSINNITYNNVWHIQQNDYTLNIPPTPTTSFGIKEVASEKYAKGIGLIYKNFQLYEFQQANANNPQAHYTGFGITMWIIDHN